MSEQVVQNSTAEKKHFVRMRNATQKFAGVTALYALDWDIVPGEVHCLMGENGCGKSTAIKILSGVNIPEPDTIIEIDGKEYSRLTPAQSKALGLHVIYQDLSLFPNLTVAENIAMEDALHSLGKLVHRDQMITRAKAALKRLDVELPLDEKVGNLPIAQRQLVAICRGLASDARLLFMDEPTASLTRSEVNSLLDVVRRLKKDGIAVVFVSHRLDEVVEIAERVTVLRDGRKLGTYPAETLNDKKLGELMTGLQIEHKVRAQDRSAAEKVLEVNKLTRRGEYRDVSFTVHKGEVLGITGLLGAGRTELALSIFGMSPPDGGEIRLSGKPMQARSNRQAIDAGIAYVSEDRLSIGVNMRQSVQDNMCLAVLHRLASCIGWVSPTSRHDTAAKWRDKLRIKIPALEAPVSQLSGGNQQRVVLAKWLATEPKLLILDSPTVGVDIGARAGIFRIVRSLADSGLAILLISDEATEVMFNSDRVLHMAEGHIIAEYDPRQMTVPELEERVYA